MMQQKLDAIRAQCEVAPSGEWYSERCMDFTNIKLKSDKFVVEFDVIAKVCGCEIVDFIVHAYTDIPALLADVERLQVLLTMAKNGLAVVCKTCACYPKQKECFHKCHKWINDDFRSLLWRWRGEINNETV